MNGFLTQTYELQFDYSEVAVYITCNEQALFVSVVFADIEGETVTLKITRTLKSPKDHILRAIYALSSIKHYAHTRLGEGTNIFYSNNFSVKSFK